MTEPDVALIVCGTRTFGFHRLLEAKLDALTAKLRDFVVCTGAGRHKVAGREVGADWFAEQWAYKRYKTVKLFHPDPDLPVPARFHARNRQMVEHTRHYRKAFCVAFHDGSSPGTKSVIHLCRKAGIPTRVILYEE